MCICDPSDEPVEASLIADASASIDAHLVGEVLTVGVDGKVSVCVACLCGCADLASACCVVDALVVPVLTARDGDSASATGVGDTG